MWTKIRKFHLWFQVLYLLQKLIVLFHQLIMAFCLGLLELQRENQGAHSWRLIKHSVTAQGIGNAELGDKTFIIVSAVTCRKTCFNPDSPSRAHPFYVLDNFIDVGLIDLNLLPGNKESDGLSLGYNFFWISSGKIRPDGSMHRADEGATSGWGIVCVSMHRTLQPGVSLWSSLGWSSPFSFDPSASSTPFSL